MWTLSIWGGRWPRATRPFCASFAEAVHAAGGYLMAALAPKTSDDQPGVLYEGHDYAAIGQETDKILLMTYEWGFTYGPPMAVAPLNAVERVVTIRGVAHRGGEAFIGLSQLRVRLDASV